MSIKEMIKNEIDTLPDEIVYIIRDFVLFQKYRSLLEMDDTTYLSMIPGMLESIQDGVQTPIHECLESHEVWGDV